MADKNNKAHTVAPAKAGVQVVMFASTIYVYAEWRRARKKSGVSI